MLKRTLLYIFFLFQASLILFSCAKQGSLSGGPKDINPPRMIKEKSDSNFQTQHYPKSITLSFDEWIQIKNSSQILVSPPLEFRPQINTKGKSVVVTFDKNEVLRDSTTYSVNFGNAICDFNESNPVENFQFVFCLFLFLYL